MGRISCGAKSSITLYPSSGGNGIKLKINKKMKQKSLFSALTTQFKDKNILIVCANYIKKKLEKSVLFILLYKGNVIYDGVYFIMVSKLKRYIVPN